MYLIFFLVCLLSSVIGAICGIGGGIIIKPVLDTTGILSVSSISFLSGCTVLSMSLVSMSKEVRRKDKRINYRSATPLAIGGAIGGIVGKELFQYTYIICPDENTIGAIQAGVLVVITIGTLIYTIYQTRVKTYYIKSLTFSCLIGLFLGMLSSFLGIGGGPINLIVLGFFFSMETKKAVANSLYIIMFSQLTSLLSSVLQENIPEFSFAILLFMVAGGIAGGWIGNKINSKISSKTVSFLFGILMIVIIGVNLYNLYKFSIKINC